MKSYSFVLVKRHEYCSPCGRFALVLYLNSVSFPFTLIWRVSSSAAFTTGDNDVIKNEERTQVGYIVSLQEININYEEA